MQVRLYQFVADFEELPKMLVSFYLLMSHNTENNHSLVESTKKLT